MARKFWDRRQGKWIVLLDVDCRLLRPIDDWVDVGLRIDAKVRKWGDVKLHVCSGTMIFAPTEAARWFLDIWEFREPDRAAGRQLPH